VAVESSEPASARESLSASPPGGFFVAIAVTATTVATVA
jgi:hypothetical protein